MILYTTRENFWFSFGVKNTSKAALEETSEAEKSKSHTTDIREGLFAKFESLIPAPYFRIFQRAATKKINLLFYCYRTIPFLSVS
jgi:hypothetical protein